MESVDFLVVGCGPAGATAAREAARNGIETIVLEKDAVVGEKRVCAAGLRPGFCDEFDLPRDVVHCDTPRLALFDSSGQEHGIALYAAGHTSTREELDGTMGRLAAEAGAQIRTRSLFRSYERDGDCAIVEYADQASGERRRISARSVFLAPGATARVDDGAFAFDRWRDGLMTTLQYRVFLDRPATASIYKTLELHYYPAGDGRQIVAWVFPKRDHLAIGLGLTGKLPGGKLREELDIFTERCRERLYPTSSVISVKEEGHLLYGGDVRPVLSDAAVMLGGTGAGLVDATTGEGIFEAAISGRLAAEAIAAFRGDRIRAATRYARVLAGRFARRLTHRVKLMRFLERRPTRYGMLFEQLADFPRFAEALQKENFERSVGDRLYLYGQALKFALRAAGS